MNIHTRDYMMSKFRLGSIEPFWDEQYKDLNYYKVVHNNPQDMKRWRKEGYTHPDELFTGAMCPHGEKHPSWTSKIVEWLEKDFGWKDIGANFYRMETGVILPTHADLYQEYTKKFNLTQRQSERVLLLLEDWKPGHYLEVNGKPIVDWKAGYWVWWPGDMEHAASNIGIDYRYSLQLTGHI